LLRQCSLPIPLSQAASHISVKGDKARVVSRYGYD
jgi:hypothetical protein